MAHIIFREKKKVFFKPFNLKIYLEIQGLLITDKLVISYQTEKKFNI